MTRDSLWGSRDAVWTENMIDEFMTKFKGEFDPTNTVREGKRVEVVNGERREYRLTDDGEWERIDNKGLLNIDKADGGYEWTVDMSMLLPDGNFDASAKLNNGVLTVSFNEEDE